MTSTNRVFLCHNSKDKDQVKGLALALLKLGAVRTWLDEWEVRGGEKWEAYIRKEFAASAACLVLVGPHGLGPFQRLEVGWANERESLDASYRVIPVLLPHAEDTGRQTIAEALPGVHWVAVDAGWATVEALTPLLAAIRGGRRGPPVRAISAAVAAENWEGSRRSNRSLLYRGHALAEARALAIQAGALDELSLEFIAASEAAASTRARLTIATLGTASSVLLATAWWANRQRLAAEEARTAETAARGDAEHQRDAASAAQAAERDARVAEELQRKEADRRRDEAEAQRRLASRDEPWPRVAPLPRRPAGWCRWNSWPHSISAPGLSSAARPPKPGLHCSRR